MDNALRDLGEPAELTIPVHIASFEKLLARARTLLGCDYAKLCCPKAAEFLLCNFGTTDDVGRWILNDRDVRAIAPRESVVRVVAINDRADLLDDILSICPESLVLEMIVKFKAQKCLADWVAKSRNIVDMLSLADDPDVYGPLIDSIVGTPEFDTLIGFARPGARIYAFRKDRRVSSIEIYRLYLDAAARVDDGRRVALEIHRLGHDLRGDEGVGQKLARRSQFAEMFRRMNCQAIYTREREPLYAIMREYGY